MIAKIISLLSALLLLGQGALQGYVKETNLGGNLYLVNREFRLAPDYVPKDLRKPNVKMENGNQQMRIEAADALEELFAAAKKEKGHDLVLVSGYRSYFSQRNIYGRRVKRSSVAAANQYVALPGTSEHQTGLVADVGKRNGDGLVAAFGASKEGRWLKENAHRFGFVIRYQRGWEEITGYQYEPWHIRYVGKEHAAYMYEHHIPLEYYVEAVKQARFAQWLLDGEISQESREYLKNTGGVQ